MDEYLSMYREEVQELLGEVETLLGRLQENPDDLSSAGAIFCAVHTIKASSFLMRFQATTQLVHELETVFNALRETKIRVTDQLIEATYSACDLIRSLADGGDALTEPSRKTYDATIRTLKELLLLEETPKPVPEATGCTLYGELACLSLSRTYRIRMRPTIEGLNKGKSPFPVLGKLRELGDFRISCHRGTTVASDDPSPGDSYACWDVILSMPAEKRGEAAIRKIFQPIQEHCELSIDLIDDGATQEAEHDYKKLGEILVERGDVNPEVIEKTLQTKRFLGEMLVDAGVVAPAVVESALLEQQYVRQIREKRQKMEQLSSIKVPAEKLDHLLGRIDALETLHQHLHGLPHACDVPQCHHLLGDLGQLIANIRETARTLRTDTLGRALGHLKGVAADLASMMGKEAVLIIDDEAMEVDRLIVERLKGPLLHLIRNSIDHGIERPEARRASGKKQHGTLCLSAHHSDSQLMLEFSDDGKGLDTAAIRTRADELGLIGRDTKVTEEELSSLILSPGFSTKGKSTMISGRGVGLDVLKRAVDTLNGSIGISSRKGSGTRITIQLPACPQGIPPVDQATYQMSPINGIGAPPIP